MKSIGEICTVTIDIDDVTTVQQDFDQSRFRESEIQKSLTNY